MGQWLRFLTSGGTIDGKRIVSKATLEDITRPHMKINETLSYGLGWATYRWNGHAVVEHNGGSQGISALVSFIPGRCVGFAFLANTSPNPMTTIGNAGRLLWPLLLDEKTAPALAAPSTAAAGSPPAADTATASTGALPAVDDLLVRMIAAQGGERNLRRHCRMEVRARKVYENQGVHADLIIRASAPFSRTEVAFRTTIHDALGEATIEVTDVQFNGAIPAAAFGPAMK